MSAKYYSFFICIFFLIKCTNAPSDLSKYKKFSYFDELTMQGVGSPNSNAIEEDEFVYVKKGDSTLISVYYPYKDVLIHYAFEDSMWRREYYRENEEIGEKYKFNFFSLDDSMYVVYRQDYQYLEKYRKCTMCFSQKDFSIWIRVDCNLKCTRENLREIIKEHVKIQKFKNLKNDDVLIRKFNVGNYTLFYKLEKHKNNAYLSSAVNRSITPPIHDEIFTDTEIFLTKYPEYKYKTNLREF